MTTAACLETLAKVKAARRFGKVTYGCVARPFASAGTAAQEFGLSGKAAIYREIQADEAVSVLATVLHRDMAYDQQIMPAARALGLAKAFADCFPRDTARFFTNGTFGRKREAPSWSPATDATFDTGVIVLSSGIAACLWFQDED